MQKDAVTRGATVPRQVGAVGMGGARFRAGNHWSCWCHFFRNRTTATQNSTSGCRATVSRQVGAVGMRGTHFDFHAWRGSSRGGGSRLDRTLEAAAEVDIVHGRATGVRQVRTDRMRGTHLKVHAWRGNISGGGSRLGKTLKAAAEIDIVRGRATITRQMSALRISRANGSIRLRRLFRGHWVLGRCLGGGRTGIFFRRIGGRTRTWGGIRASRSTTTGGGHTDSIEAFRAAGAVAVLGTGSSVLHMGLGRGCISKVVDNDLNLLIVRHTPRPIDAIQTPKIHLQ